MRLPTKASLKHILLFLIVCMIDLCVFGKPAVSAFESIFRRPLSVIQWKQFRQRNNYGADGSIPIVAQN
jgi:hypothetical protein